MLRKKGATETDAPLHPRVSHWQQTPRDIVHRPSSKVQPQPSSANFYSDACMGCVLSGRGCQWASIFYDWDPATHAAIFHACRHDSGTNSVGITYANENVLKS